MRKIVPVWLALAVSAFLFGKAARRQRSLRRWQPGPRGTALVTGASSGIGASYARVLARQGYNLRLVARRVARLQALAEEIRQSGVQVEIWVADLSDPVQVEQVAQQIAALDDLAILVNNAGFGVTGLFAEASIAEQLAMTRLHLEASMRLTHAALPGMLQRGQGGVIQVSSLTALAPIAGNAVYGATKNYLVFFTQALREELRGSGVRVQALCPGFTRTEIFDRRPTPPALPRWLWLEPEQVVEESLRGLAQDDALVIPGAQYRALAWLLRLPGVTWLASRLRPLVMGS